MKRLTVIHLAAILIYTFEDHGNEGSRFYQVLNRALRSMDRKQIAPFVPYLRLLLEAFAHFSPFEGVVYRGLADVDLSAQFPVGVAVRTWDLMSVSQREGVALQFSKGETAQRTLFIINTVRAIPIALLSAVPDELECLLRPGSIFVASRVERLDNGLTRIYLTQQEEGTDEFARFLS
jgi:hypothetical protein